MKRSCCTSIDSFQRDERIAAGFKTRSTSQSKRKCSYHWDHPTGLWEDLLSPPTQAVSRIPPESAVGECPPPPPPTICESPPPKQRLRMVRLWPVMSGSCVPDLPRRPQRLDARRPEMIADRVMTSLAPGGDTAPRGGWVAKVPPPPAGDRVTRYTHSECRGTRVRYSLPG